MITPPLPLSLPSTRVQAIRMLAVPRCADLSCLDAAGNVHVLRCNLWTLDRLARAVWPRPVRIAFLSEAAQVLRASGPVELDGEYRLPALGFSRSETESGMRYVPVISDGIWPEGEKKCTS